MSSYDLIIIRLPAAEHTLLRLSFQFNCAKKSRSNTIGATNMLLLEMSLLSPEKANQVSKWAVQIIPEVMIHSDHVKPRSRNTRVGLQVRKCPFRPGRFLVSTQMKSLRQFVLPDWKPNPPWRAARHQTDTTAPFRAGPEPKLLLHAGGSTAGYPEIHREVQLLHIQLLTRAWSRGGATDRHSTRRPRCATCDWGITQFLVVELIMQRLSAVPVPDL